MPYTLDDFNTAITEIGSLEDVVEVRNKLTELSGNVSNIFNSHSELEKNNEKLKEDNESLRAANMKLFLSVGEKKEPEKSKGSEQPPEKRKYEDLFNEKGELK